MMTASSDPKGIMQLACGEFRGMEYERMICDVCGVRVDSHEIRRTRFAHIELAYPISHPLIAPVSTLDAIPVLPARFWESAAEARLALSYEHLIKANGARDPYRVIEAMVEPSRYCCLSSRWLTIGPYKTRS